ncbi:MAG: SMP-30/gluconolactonase/LRE family protein [Alphaproteobacteria bacterium]
MILEVRDPRLPGVVGDAVAFERLATGFLFTEGPVWDAGRGELLFSDIPGDRILRWRAADGIATFRAPSFKANGLAFDRAGRLLACEHATSRVERLEADGRWTVIASHHGEHELNSPNDIVVHRDGGIYFTDPTYGRARHYGIKRPLPLPFRGVYRAEPDGTRTTLLADDFAQPNGLCFSSDFRRLFVNDTDRKHIRVFEVDGDGLLSGGGVWAETRGEGAGAPDGMKIDAAENLWCCGPGGIHVFSPDATCLGVIRVPEYPANFTWGEGDLRSLFVTASTSLYRIRTAVAGRGF